MRRGLRVVFVALGLGACSDEPAAPGAAVRTRILPEEWGGGGSASFAMGTDHTNGRGTLAAYIASLTPPTTGFATFTQSIHAEHYRGNRVRWSGWVRPTGVTSAGLWMRVDGPGQIQGFDNMSDRAINGTSTWREFEVVLDVPANAIGLSFGVLLSGSGDVVVDDFSLEIVGSDIPSTDMLDAPAPGPDSLTVSATYERRRARAVNLDFEGVAAHDAATIAWLRDNSSPITTSDPGGPFTDLEPLGRAIGSARIVGLGEGTHGTREFFMMKNRIFEYLVRTMGFTHFGIEASWPESNDLNRYVLTGAGDPAALIRALGFWTWDTFEVLDLVNWMRQWNVVAPPSSQVQFLGFDMQAPGASMDTVTAFIARVSPSSASLVSERYGCITPFRNIGRTFSRPRSDYHDLPAATRAACRAALQEVYDLIADNRDAFEQASAPSVYENALRSARLVQQFEAYASAASAESFAVRDRAMAENVDWILAQGGPDARVVLWAHNGHVINRATSMGGVLRREHDASYVNLGFLFGRGNLTAVGPNLLLQELSATLVPAHSLEAAFLATGRTRVLLDANKLASPGAPTVLRDPVPMRSIGALFNPSFERNYYVLHALPADFDLLIFFASTGASRRLP